MGMTTREICSVLTACILMVLSASATIWHYAGVNTLRRVTRIDEYYIHIIKTLLPVGTVVGTIIFGISAEAVGRKITLLAVAVPYAIAFIMFQFAKTIPLVCIGQVIAGLSIGGTLVVLPIYIGEMAAPTSRGLLGALMTAFFYFGMLLYYVLGTYASHTVINVSTICLAVIFFIVFIIIGLESPFYYIKKLKNSHDEEILEINLTDKYNEDEIKYIKETKIMSCFGSTGWIKSVTIMLFLIVVYHLSAVYMIPMLIHYTHRYFEYKDVTLAYETILISTYALQLIGSSICALLVDKIGRKFCLMISTLGIGIFLVPIAIHSAVRDNYRDIEPIPTINIIFVVTFLIFFNIGISPVPQILLGEMFPLRTKTAAVTILVSIQQVTVFIAGTFYPEITYAIGYTACLFICMVSMFVATGLIYFIVLETKQKSLQEIQLALKNK